MCSLIIWSVCSHSTWKFLLLKELEFHLELQKTICYKTSKWYHYQSYLENPNTATNDRIAFHLCSYSKLLSRIILHFTKIKPLKSYQKCLLFHLNCFFGFWNIQILREIWGNWEVENGIIMASWNGLCKLLILIFGKTCKTSLN